MNRLARDVGINVVANLVAAAIIYLLGLSAGLFPYSVELTVAATILITLVMLAVIIQSSRLRPGHQKARARLSVVYLYAVSVPLSIVYATILRDKDGHLWSEAEQWSSHMFVGVVTVAAVVSVPLMLHEARKIYLKEFEAARIEQRREVYRNRPYRRRASREPRIIRRQRLRDGS